MKGKTMQQRMKYQSYAPDLMKQVYALNKAVEESGLEMSLLHLVKLRASQINGCSFCVDMHSKEAIRDGDTQQRVFLVSAWKESPLFSDRERAAFAYTDAVTKISEQGVPDALWEATRKHFSEEELTKLTIAIGMINIWNRICVSFHVLHPVEHAKAA
jgi:AhpD family alkylhydroperoxidase